MGTPLERAFGGSIVSLGDFPEAWGELLGVAGGGGGGGGICVPRRVRKCPKVSRATKPARRFGYSQYVWPRCEADKTHGGMKGKYSYPAGRFVHQIGAIEASALKAQATTDLPFRLTCFFQHRFYVFLLFLVLELLGYPRNKHELCNHTPTVQRGVCEPNLFPVCKSGCSCKATRKGVTLTRLW